MQSLSQAAPASPGASGGALSSLAAEGPVDLVAPGDLLQINIYEVGVTLFGGLAGIGGAAQGLGGPAVAAPGAQMAGVVVASDGTIRVPYVGTLNVAGKTIPQIQRMIEDGLRGKSQSPQVMVNVLDSVRNSAYIFGAVGKPGRVPLSVARQRLLDVIAVSGGFGGQSVDGLVRVTRGNRTAEMRLSDLKAGSDDDLILLPGDRIELVSNPRTFSVFGATRVAQIGFGAEALTLAEAVARAGGPSDAQADPSAIFLFRYGATAGGTSTAPVIYRLNLMKPESYFLAQRFLMQDKDVIYMANSASNPPTKFISILNQLFSPIVTARVLTNNN